MNYFRYTNMPEGKRSLAGPKSEVYRNKYVFFFGTFERNVFNLKTFKFKMNTNELLHTKVLPPLVS